MSQVIWGNGYFKSKHKTLFFKHWIECGFVLVNDLFTKHGKWLQSDEIFTKLLNKRNWLIELTILKKTVNKVVSKIDSTICKYIQQKLFLNVNFYHMKVLINPYLIKSRYIYCLLLKNKSVRPYSEKKWERILNISLSHNEWSNIYCNNFCPIKYKKLCEFKYKILLDILLCGYTVNKWNSTVSSICKYYNIKESITHMLYECKKIKPINQLGNLFSFQSTDNMKMCIQYLN